MSGTEPVEASDDLIILVDQEVTASGRAFLRQHEHDLMFVAGTAIVFSHLREVLDGLDGVYEALHPEEPSPGKFRQSIDSDATLKAVEDVAKAQRIELAMTRYVDNYLAYLADILREVLRARPEVLSSRRATVTVEEALRHTTIDDLRSFIAERTVASLTFAGLQDLDNYFAERLGLPLSTDPATRQYLGNAVVLRNVLTHRRGVIDERAIQAGLRGDEYKVGERLQLPTDEVRRLNKAVVSAVLDLDARVATKFGLTRVRHEPAWDWSDDD